jgi:glycosyltransferase involved in cell wall biosynthesis
VRTRPVLFTGDVFRLQPRGGISRYVVEIASRLRRPTRVAGGVHGSVEALRLGELLAPAVRLPFFRGAPRLFAPLNHLIDRAELGRAGDAIVHPSYYRDPAGLPARSPVVVTVHDMTHERLPDRFRGIAGAERDPARHKAALCRRAQLVLCNSESTRRDVLELLDVPESRVRLTPHASRDWAGVTPRSVPEARTPFFLWIGERHGYKNFVPALEAWAGSTECRDTSLLCVGGKTFSAAERDTLRRLGVGARVARRACSDEQVRWAYEHAVALYYPSLWEGFGVPVLEALALGCPVVTSDRPPLHEVGGNATIFVDPEDRDALADGLRRAREQTREATCVAARQAQSARFSWDRCARQHEAAYAELD